MNGWFEKREIVESAYVTVFWLLGTASALTKLTTVKHWLSKLVPQVGIATNLQKQDDIKASRPADQGY